MPTDLAFRTLLIGLEDDMTVEERKKFVFLLGDDIPKRKREEPLVDILSILIDRELISPRNCSYLIKIFEVMKLTTLAYQFAHFETSKLFLIFLVLLFFLQCRFLKNIVLRCRCLQH